MEFGAKYYTHMAWLFRSSIHTMNESRVTQKLDPTVPWEYVASKDHPYLMNQACRTGCLTYLLFARSLCNHLQTENILRQRFTWHRQERKWQSSIISEENQRHLVGKDLTLI